MLQISGNKFVNKFPRYIGILRFYVGNLDERILGYPSSSNPYWNNLNELEQKLRGKHTWVLLSPPDSMALLYFHACPYPSVSQLAFKLCACINLFSSLWISSTLLQHNEVQHRVVSCCITATLLCDWNTKTCLLPFGGCLHVWQAV